MLNVGAGIDPLTGVLLGTLLATAGALVIGYFCTKVSGIAFLMLTMAFSQLLFSLALRWRDVTGGTDGLGGLEAPVILGWTLAGPVPIYYLAAAALVFGFWVTRRIVASPLGHALAARDRRHARARCGAAPPACRWPARHRNRAR